MDTIYIIYDTDSGCWTKAYRSFDAAITAVKQRITTENEAYVKSPNFIIEPELPAGMDAHDIYNVKSGICVAHIYDYKIEISIKEIKLE